MSEDSLKIGQARHISDWDGIILSSECLALVDIDHIVRIYIYYDDGGESSDSELHDYSSDAPYVKVVSVANENEKREFLGEILSINRASDDKKYPFPTGERIWFTEDNIFEIPTHRQPEDAQPKYAAFRNKEGTKVKVTGPRYLIITPESTEDDDDELEGTPTF